MSETTGYIKRSHVREILIAHEGISSDTASDILQEIDALHIFTSDDFTGVAQAAITPNTMGLLKTAREIIIQYAEVNPTWVCQGRLQDPCGAHKWLEDYTASQRPKPMFSGDLDPLKSVVDWTSSVSSTPRATPPLCGCKASQRDGQHMAWCPAISSTHQNTPEGK